MSAIAKSIPRRAQSPGNSPDKSSLTDGSVPANDRYEASPRHGRKRLDLAVLLASLLVFVLFLFLLDKIVFPKGSRLEDIISSQNSDLPEIDERGQLQLADADDDGIGRFVAYLADVRRDVKIREADSVVWSRASEGFSVHNRDAVQTFSDSRARVDFTTDNELRIAQNSLVIFRSGASDPFLERREAAVVVLDGELSGNVNAEYGAFPVELPVGLVILKTEQDSKDDVNFRVGVNPDKSSTIAVYSGQADINIAGEHYSIPANKGLTISEDGNTTGVRGLPTLPFVQSPNHNSVETYLDLPPRVKFRWSAVANAQNYRFEMAKDRNFDEILVDDVLPRPTFTHSNLAPGDYYWRVSALSGWVQGPASAPRRLRITRDSDAPFLEIEAIKKLPAGGYALRGRTTDAAKVYVLGQPVKTSTDGRFEYFFDPEPGTRSIVVEAIDAVGNVAYSSQVLNVPSRSGRSN